MSSDPAVQPRPYDGPSILKLFDSLAAMRKAMASAESGAGILDDRAFELLTDHLVIVTPASQLGRYRFRFCGSTVAEMARCGDVAGLSFGDIMVDDSARHVLAGYRHVENVRTAHVTANQPVVSAHARLFTRLLMPLFMRDKIALMVGAVIFHDDPIVLGEATRFADRND